MTDILHDHKVAFRRRDYLARVALEWWLLADKRGGENMPVILRRGGLSYFFYSNEGLPPEPPHIHVRGGGRDAKVWLQPEVLIEDSYGFNPRQLSNILRTVSENREVLLRAWHDYFGD